MNKNRMNIKGKKRRKLGFSLSEVLMVVVIIGILAAFTGVSAVKMYKDMKQTQLDKTAETIFHAAQDRLSELYAYGKEDLVSDGNVIDSSKSLLYITNEDTGLNAYKAIMGDNTVSSDVLNNYWGIAYQASTCRVLNVVYAEKSDGGIGGFGVGINAASSLSTMKSDLINHTFADRKDKYGWFGDATLADLQENDNQVGNTSVNVEIINEENLYAHVRVSVGWEDNLSEADIAKFLEKITITLTLKDADDASMSAASKDFTLEAKKLLSAGTINSDASGYYNAHSDADDGTAYVTNKYLSASWDMLIDSLSDDSFVDGGNTKKTFSGFGTGIDPGNNFYLIAKLESNDGSTPVVQDYDVDNSLFAAGSGGKAYIEYGRHLQNAAKAEITGLNAVQIADLDFNSAASFARSDNFDEYNKYWLSVYPDASGYTDYQPYDSSYLASYDGQNHIIRNLDIGKATESTGNAGIFGNLSNATSISNVIITDSTVNVPGASAAGMFAGKFGGSSALTIEKCYIGKVNVDGSSSASIGGFAGEINSGVTARNCGFLSVNAGNNVAAANAGSFAGKLSGILDGTNLYTFGGTVKAATNAGGLIGLTESAISNLTLNGCRVSGTDISASSGNAGGIIGYARNQNATLTIGSDTTVAGSVVRATSGNAGGFTGNAESIVNITDSAYYMPASTESAQTAGKVSKEFAKAVGLSGSADEVPMTYADIKSAAGFKYVNELNTGAVSGLRWISGTTNAGGLIGVSNKNVTVTNTFASGVLSGIGGNAGGFVGNTSGKLAVTGSYTDFYISGKNVGGFAAACGSNSSFESCYTAGFLVGSADSAAGFAPVAVGNIANSYTVFNFDNVSNTTLFTGTAESDADHDINVNGTVSNYPSVATHSFYPVAMSNSGKAYYVYSETDFVENDKTVSVRAEELANNQKEGESTPLLNGSFNKGLGKDNTVPYSLASFFGTTLKDYPFPTLKVNKTVNGTSTETVLKHYNDWLIIDKDSMFDIEVWYMMYDENMKTLEKNVAGIGSDGYRYHGKAKAIEVKNGSATEYQINVGSRDIFSGYKFVGYFDPVTASAPLTTTGATFDRSQKLDYLTANDDLAPAIESSLKDGDRVVQTSISGKNLYGYKCEDHDSIFEESTTNNYAKTKRIYAVYRYNKPYVVTLSYREYKLPKTTDDVEEKSLEEIYTKSSKLTSDDLFEVTYTSPADVYKFVYADQTAIRDKVGTSHSNLASDEELTEDFIAEKVLAERFPNANTYKEKLAVLNDIRAGKKVTLSDGTVIAANDKNQITRKIADFKDAGFDLLDFDKLLSKKLINSNYYTNVTETRPVYTIVRLDPAKDSDGKDVAFKDRAVVEVEKDSNDKITLFTNKTYEYVILYNTNKASQTLNLVFRNTTPNESSDIPVIDRYDTFNAELKERKLDTVSSHVYRVKVSSDGFKDIETAAGRLQNLMKPEGHPSFEGFTLADAEYDLSDDRDIVTLYYDRDRYTLSARFDRSLDPGEQYKSSTTAPTWTMFYGQSYQDYLWEIASSEIQYSIEGPYEDRLKTHTGTIYIYDNETDYYRDNYTYKTTGYAGLVSYILNPQMPAEGDFIIEIYFNNKWRGAWHSWSKSGGDSSYAFTRQGYVLSGFKVYYQNSDGEYEERPDLKTESIEKVLTMPDCNVIVEPQWIVNPKYLRVEIYYQSPYDDINPEKEKDKEYEYYKGTLLKVNNGVANQLIPDSGQPRNLAQPIPISELITEENSSGGLIEYLEHYYRDDIFYKRTDHHFNASEGINTYKANYANTKTFGTHHFSGKDTMVVGLYYDREEVEYRYHFITSNSVYTPSYNYRIATRSRNGNQWVYSSQWDDITKTDLYTYSGDAEDRIALKNILVNKTGTYTSVGKHAMVKVETGTHHAVANTNVTYGGLDSYGNYHIETVTTTNNSNKVDYGITIYYKALYGAPAVFSSDEETCMIPTWYYQPATGKTDMQMYIIGGSTRREGMSTTSTYFTGFSVKTFSDVDSYTASLKKDMYPSYPGDNTGKYTFYIEKAPYDDPNWTNYRTSDSQTVNVNRFDLNDPKITQPGKDSTAAIGFNANNAPRTFIAGYSTFAYSEYSGDKPASNSFNQVSIVNDLVSPSSAGRNSKNVGILLKRNTYHMIFVDAELTDSTYNTSYLYKQEITGLPGETMIEGTAGDDYIFDGWYTSSTPTDDTKVADRYGNILIENCKKLSAFLVDDDDTLLMNHEDMQLFANWVPSQCYVTFNPFYPDNMSYGVDERLGFEEPIPYGEKISELPEVLAPKNYGPNYTIETEGDDIFYVVKDNNGEIVGKYKFLGWYKYIGNDTPSGMDDLKVEFKEDESLVTNTITLYAKWETIIKEATYTITCRDYGDGDKVIFSVIRTGTDGVLTTINPPKYNDDDGKDLRTIFGSYEDLTSYEALSNAVETVLQDGMNFTFRYKKAPEWKFNIITCINVDGTDIVIDSKEETTAYVLKQVEVPTVLGYEIYQYQIGDNPAVDKTNPSDPIPVERPADITEPLDIIIRYHFNSGILTAKAAVDYEKYDALDFVVAGNVEIPEGESWKDALFSWNDSTYAPAILYTVQTDTAFEYLGNDYDATVSDQAADTISNRNPGTYDVTMKLVAINKEDSTDYLEIQDITGGTSVTISESSYSVKFADNAILYYSIAGDNAEKWCWDKELRYVIGPDGTSIVNADTEELPEAVKSSAETVKGIITDTYDESTVQYKAFFVLVGDQAYTVVDNFGKLRNGDKLNKKNHPVYMENRDGEGAYYEITLYNADGSEGETITVYIQ